MRLQPILTTAGYLFGALLHGALLRLVARRTSRRHGEPLIALLAAALLVWNGTNLIAAVGELVTQRRLVRLGQLVDLAGVPALALVPSLILHTLVTLRRRADEREARRFPSDLLLYAPLPALAAIFLLAREAFPAALGAWLWTSLMSGAALAFDLSRRSARRQDALKATPSLYRFLAATLLFTALLAAAIVFLLGWREGSGHVAKDLLVAATSTLPTGALAYGVYRYYAIRVIVRRGVVDLGIGVAALGIYLLVISEMSHALHARYGWDARALEGLGIVALFFILQPFRRRLLGALSWAFDPSGTKGVEVFRGLAQDLSRPGASQPAELAARVATGIREALLLENAALAIAVPPGQAVPASPPGWIDYRALLAAMADAPARMILPRELEDPAVARALEAAWVERLRPLRYEGELAGALVLGRRADSTRIRDEELEAVEAIAAPLAAACTSVRLVDQKLSLERRLAGAERLAALGRFSATVAHRVKNPLASIKAIAQAFREDLAPEDPRQKDMTVVIEEVDVLTRVVSQLLGFARGAPAGAVGPVDIRVVAEDVILLMQHQAAAAGVAVKLLSGGNVPPVVGEAGALREVLANLVENAIHASPPSADVTVSIDEPRAGTVRVRVRDQGPGVPAEMRARIFEPFFTTRSSGTGLGLTVSRQRAEAFGGRIEVEDGAGPGAVFALELAVSRDEMGSGT